MKINYPSAFLICGGDINDLKVGQLLGITKNLKQIVTKATRQGKTLSVIVTDLHAHYGEPNILDPVQPDTPGKGKPSDHSTPLAIPSTNNKKKCYRIKVQPFPDSGIREFGRWIVRKQFEEVFNANSPTDKVKEFTEVMEKKVEEIFPKKRMKIFDKDKEWINPQLQKLRRMKAREYRRKNKSQRYNALQKQFLNLKNKLSKKYIKDNIAMSVCGILGYI